MVSLNGMSFDGICEDIRSIGREAGVEESGRVDKKQASTMAVNIGSAVF